VSDRELDKSPESEKGRLCVMSERAEFAPERLAKQVDFILEIDRLKNVIRRTALTDQSRRENSAEHSWHLAVMALLLHEYADGEVDIQKVVRLLLVHDLVEIDAGDTFCYDEAGNVGRADRERAAAERLFSILPDEQGEQFRALWEEFESRNTSEARFAAALDRMQPLLSNLATQGYSWQKYGVAYPQVLERTRSIAEGSERLWEYMRARLDEAVEEGILAP
jgi:putative hydrolase of HD superfamily